jgi:hypothetical protein
MNQGFSIAPENQVDSTMSYDDAIEHEHEQHEVQERNAQERMDAMEAAIRGFIAQRTTDQAAITTLQQQQRDSQAIIDQQGQTINSLRQQLQNNSTTVNPTVAPVVAPAVPPTVTSVVTTTTDTEPELGKVLKPEHPPKFDGDTAKLRTFLRDLRTHFDYYFPDTFAPSKLEKRVRYAGTRMEGAALDWFNAIIADKEQNPNPTEQNEVTREIFNTYVQFESHLEKAFGITNEAQDAEKKLRDFRQKGPCFKYTSQFIQLLTKVNWTEDSKKEMYYHGLKPEVKDEIYKIDRQNISFTSFTQEAVKIDNRQWERKQEKKAERSGNPVRHHPQANQGKKRDEYIARDNGTRPGRMDIDTINQKKFTGECRACGKKGHKEADCRSKLTCGFCKKPGHKEADCYSKKKIEKEKMNPGPRDKIQVDSISETKHELLSWTACYNDTCPIHESDKKGASYYPSKKQRPQKKDVIHVDSIVYREGRIDDLGSDHESTCEYCGSNEPGSFHECDQKPSLFGSTSNGDGLYQCENCQSWDQEHECHGCKRCGSMEGYQHFCPPEYEENIQFAYENSQEEDKLAENHLREQQIEEIRQYLEEQQGEPSYPSQLRYLYTCKMCKSHDLDHDCEGCPTCGSHDEDHDCNEVLYELVQEHRRQEQRRQYLEENPPEQISIHEGRKRLWFSKIDLSKAYDHIPIPKQIDNINENCGQRYHKQCDNIYCEKHAYDKLEQWHRQRQHQKEKYAKKCDATHFLDCITNKCRKHHWEKHLHHQLKRKLTNKGYNFDTHTNTTNGNKALIKKYHRMIKDRNPEIKCKWCVKYGSQTWEENPLDQIHVDSIGQSRKKLFIEGYINQHPVTIYVDSGADRNFITPSKAAELQLPTITKDIPGYISSIIHPDHEITISHETDHLELTVAGRTEILKADLLELENCDIMLGHPWLEMYNPLINWKTKQILWDLDVTPEL